MWTHVLSHKSTNVEAQTDLVSPTQGNFTFVKGTHFYAEAFKMGHLVRCKYRQKW